MKISEYAALQGEAKSEAFKQAKLEWLRILFHDWHEGGYDAHIEEYFTVIGDDIFITNDDTLALKFGMWCFENKKERQD